MTIISILCLSAFGLLLVTVLGWRVLGRRLSLPCPPALIWLLENRVMENVAGSTAIMERAGVARGMRVLDAGCGPGRVTIPMAKHVGPQGQVVALDIQPRMLARLAERTVEHGITNVRAIHGGLGEGLLGTAEFDRAVMVTVLGEIPDRVAALREIHDALKPGGLLSITEVLPDPHYQSRRAVRRMAEEVGFKVEEAYSGRRSFTLNLIRTGGA
jgi:ubiquinone/menaquinone biosynthesis C-methylase UbiE